MAAIVCPFCAAKVKGTRVQCPKCGEKLTGQVLAPAAPFLSRHRRAAAGLAGALSLALVVAVLSRPDRPGGGTTAAPSPTPIASAPKGVAAAVPLNGTPNGNAPVEDRADPKHGGTAAYARGDYQLAFDRYERAIKANPQDADALNNFGQVLARAGQPAEAITYFQRALALYPNVWTYRFNLAHAQGQLGNWREAANGYESAAAVNPDDYVIHYNLAMALHKLGNEEAAVAEYQRAIALAPGEPSFRLSLGISYERLNRPAEAAKAYEEYLEMDPSAPDAARIRAQIDGLRKPA